MKIKELSTEQPPFDSRESFQSFKIDKITGILTLTTKGQDKLELKGAEITQFMEDLGFAISIAKSAEPNPKEYPAQKLMTATELCDVILSPDSMRDFVSASEFLQDDKYLASIHEKTLRVNDLPISSRVLNDWTHKQGLLVDNRENVEQWRTFSKIDRAYICILKTCRNFGVSLHKLETSKKSFSAQLHNTGFTLIEIAYAYFEKSTSLEDVYLIMDTAGRCNIFRAQDMAFMTKEKLIKTNLILNLNEVWNEK